MRSGERRVVFPTRSWLNEQLLPRGLPLGPGPRGSVYTVRCSLCLHSTQLEARVLHGQLLLLSSLSQRHPALSPIVPGAEKNTPDKRWKESRQALLYN